jgi:hypothetical protein
MRAGCILASTQRFSVIVFPITTINNIEDLIRLLDENPEWAEALRARVLTRELLEVPQTLARFIESANTRFDRLETDVSQLKEDVAVLKEDVAVLKGDVAGMKVDVGYLKGVALETSLHRKIIPRVSQRFGLRRAQIVISPVQGIQPEFRDAIEDAMDRGAIDGERMHRVFLTDLILRGVSQESRTPLWVAVEASHKVREADIGRAVETANILEAVFGESSVAAVVGLEIDPEDLRRTDEADVVYFEFTPE